MTTIPPMIYRTFLALPMPDAWDYSIILSISDLQKQLPAGSVQWELPTRAHLTFQFLGDTSHADVNALLQALTGTLANVKPVTTQLSADGYGVFYEGGQPRYIFRSVDPMDDVLELRKQIVRTTELVGWPAPDDTFVPHVTVGHVNQDLSDDDMSAVRKFAAEDAVGHPSVESDLYTFDSVRLYWSRRDADGESEYLSFGDISIGNPNLIVGNCESCIYWENKLPENFVHRSVEGYGICKRAMTSTMDPNDLIKDMMARITLAQTSPAYLLTRPDFGCKTHCRSTKL